MAAAAAVAVLPLAVKAGKRVVESVREGGEMVGKAKDAVNTATDVKDAVGMESGMIGKARAAASEVTKHAKSGGSKKKKLSHLIEQHIDVAVPQEVAYAQWTQFKDFATIMKAVQGVERQGRDKWRWQSKIGPSRREWLAKITEQTPSERIGWRSTGGIELVGVVTFHRLDRELTRVMVQMEYDPKGIVENVGNLLRVQRRRVWRDLKLFKHFIELRGEPTGESRERVKKDRSTVPTLAGQTEPPQKNGSSQKNGGSQRRRASSKQQSS